MNPPGLPGDAVGEPSAREVAASAGTVGPATDRVRVLALVPFHTVTGPGRQLAALAAPLAAHGFPVHVIIFKRGAGTSTYEALLEQHDVPCTVVRDRGPVDFALLRAVRRIAELHQPHILQTHGYKASAIAWLLRRRWPVPWIGFFHGWTQESLRARLYHRVDRFLLATADRIVVVARPQVGLFTRAADRVRRIDNAVLPSGGPRSDDDGIVGAALHGLSRPRLGVIGRLSREKGVDVFLQACARLHADGMDVSAVIAGEGPERARLEALCSELHLQAHVRFLGHVANIDALYRAIDGLVIPSRSEGMPNVLLEALAADLPVAATRVGEIPEILRECSGCSVAEADSPGALAAGIRHILVHGGTAASREARQRTIARYSLERRVAQHVALYREVLEAQQPLFPRQAHQ